MENLIGQRERQMLDALIHLRRAYDSVVDLFPQHMLIHSPDDVEALNLAAYDLRDMGKDMIRTADMIERSLSTFRGDND